MVNKEKIASTVQRMVDQVLEETYDFKIFDEIYYLSEYLLDPKDDSSVNFTEGNFPTSVGFSLTELKKVHTALYNQLLNKEINRKKISFLRTMRIVHALKEFEVNKGKIDFSKTTNPKVNFCVQVFSMECCLEAIWGNDNTKPLEFVHQLDKM